MALYLIRHPRPAVESGVCYGQLDLPLAEPLQAEPLATIRHALPPVWRALISSPAQRCRALAEALQPGFTTDPAWLELNFGAWEGQRWDAIDRRESDLWADDVWHRSPPGGETLAALTFRVRHAVLALLAEQGDEADIVVVTHAGPMRVVQAWAQGLNPQRYPDLPLAYGEVLSIPIENLHARG